MHQLENERARHHAAKQHDGSSAPRAVDHARGNLHHLTRDDGDNNL